MAQNGPFWPVLGHIWPYRSPRGQKGPFSALFGHLGHLGPQGAPNQPNRPLDMTQMALLAPNGPFGQYALQRPKTAKYGPKWPFLAHFGPLFGPLLAPLGPYGPLGHITLAQ